MGSPGGALGRSLGKERLLAEAESREKVICDRDREMSK